MDGTISQASAVIHEFARGSWRVSRLRPREDLLPFVERISAYSERDTSFSRRREIPDGKATVVFNLGPDLRVEHPAPAHRTFPGGRGFYTGLSSRPAFTETDRAQEGAQITLTPLGARQWLDFPLDEVGDRLIDLNDLFGPEASEWFERLQLASRQSERLTFLEDRLAARLAGIRRPVPIDLAHALRRLETTSGRIAITILASEVGCSRKHLSQRFRREFGMSPKLFARVLRFAHAIKNIGTGRIESWAQLACFCGYADQAHLSRDFQEFAGKPPGAFIRHRLPDGGGFFD